MGARGRSARRAPLRSVRTAAELDAADTSARRRGPARRLDYGTKHGLALVGALALLVAFSSSTQDIVVDAWRIEAASDSDELGLLSAAYQLGYRGALLVTDALILISASHLGWPISYTMMAVLMGVGVGASFAAVEPTRGAASQNETVALRSLRGFADAVVGPFVEFFRAYGWVALLMLAMISLYRLPEFLMGPMANPVLSRPRVVKGHRRRRPGVDRVGRVTARDCRRRPQRGTDRLFPDADYRAHHAERRHRRVCHSGLHGS